MVGYAISQVLLYHKPCNWGCPSPAKSRILYIHCQRDTRVVFRRKGDHYGVVFTVWILRSARFPAYVKPIHARPPRCRAKPKVGIHSLVHPLYYRGKKG